MKLKTVIEALENARQRYLEAHGTEPHISRTMNPILCAEVDKDMNDRVRHRAPIVTLKSKSLDKFMEIMK